MSPRVSVVTPYHNTEAFLADAIESVLAQTFTDFEYVLLDNCSTDGGRAIAERYARGDSRIRLERTTQLLPVDLNFSEGFRRIAHDTTYAKMVLADDWIFPRCIEEMVAIADAHPSAGIVSSFRLKDTRVLGDGFPWDVVFMDGRSAAREHLRGRYFLFGTQSTPMFRSEVVRKTHPFYDPTVWNADTEACYRTLLDWDFGFVHQVLSFSRVQPVSISGRVRNYHPELLDHFTVVRKFGRLFLTEEQYQETERRVRRSYFDMLGLSVLSRRDREFWEYHRTWLAALGIRLGFPVLWPHVLRALADLAFNPLNTLGRLLHRWRDV